MIRTIKAYFKGVLYLFIHVVPFLFLIYIFIVLPLESIVYVHDSLFSDREYIGWTAIILIMFVHIPMGIVVKVTLTNTIDYVYTKYKHIIDPILDSIGKLVPDN